jgi:hypothetical protein
MQITHVGLFELSFLQNSGHVDSGSVYTTVFSLSDSRKYKGGEFYGGTLPYDSIPFITEEDPNATIPFYGELYYHKPRQYSAIVFLSFLHHRVTDVNENGTRETFANELWMHSDAPLRRWRGFWRGWVGEVWRVFMWRSWRNFGL